MRSKTSYHVVPRTIQTDLSVRDTDTVDKPVKYIDYSEFQKIYMFGDKNSGFKSSGPPQNYLELRQYHLQNKKLFSDENFSVDNIALTKLGKKVEWKRPFEIIDNPQFFVNGATRFDIDQGKLGDCWFLAAVANLTINEKLFNIVVPNDQSFTEKYAGIFHFRFWQYGRWVDVVIDDQLPTIDNELVYLRSSDRHEFWPALLEKAYAKVYGSYKNLEGGQITEAFEDLCGGLSEYYEARRPEIYEIMEMSYQRQSFMGSSIISEEIEGRRDDGLVSMHAYSITGMRRIRNGQSDIKLIRLRNPWGNSVEWKGKWSDLSSDWKLLPPKLTQELLHKKPDGEFWMEAEDFQRCFSFVDICHLNPSSFLFSDRNSKHWNVNMFEGSWVPNVTAGGGLKYKKTFCNNPQYHITVQGDNTNSSYAVIIGLMQKDRRTLGQNELPLEINVYTVASGAGSLLDSSFFDSVDPIVHRSDSAAVRQLTLRLMLPVGRYCIIPSTVNPNQYLSYLLRIYSEVNANVVENDNEIGYSNDVFSEQTAIKSKNHVIKLFKKVAGNKVEVGWYGVQQALNKQFGITRGLCFMKPKILFSKDTCKNIVALWDANYSGKLDGDEFLKLMNDIASLRAIFKKFDFDNSGKLDGFELRSLLLECGYKVNREILIILMLRYGHNGCMSFENFVVCAFKLKTMINEFHRRRTIEAPDHINVTRRDWLQTTLYS